MPALRRADGVHRRDPASELFQEEVFGPVLAVTAFDTEAEAVALANGVVYGLAAGVWTSDLSRAHRVSRRVQAGSVWVNCYRYTAPQSPFGGYKASGLGRESGVDAIREYLQTKSVWIDLGDTQGPEGTSDERRHLRALRHPLRDEPSSAPGREPDVGRAGRSPRRADADGLLRVGRRLASRRSSSTRAPTRAPARPVDTISCAARPTASAASASMRRTSSRW